jgi:hypothetical protein
MENVRPVLVNENTRSICMVVSIAAYVITTVAQQHRFARAAGKPFRKNAAGKAGTDDEVVVG